MLASGPLVSRSEDRAGAAARPKRSPSSPPRLTLFIVWLIATSVVLLVVICRGDLVSGAVDSLVEADLRTSDQSEQSLWIHLELQEEEGAVDESAGIVQREEFADPAMDELSSTLQASVRRVREEFEELWVPIAAPAQETSAWLNSHLLYMIPPARHGEVASLLEPANIDAAVAGIRARLSSPLFAVAGDTPRRDPLGLSALLGDTLLGLRGLPGGAEATAAGDLRSTRGRALLLELRTDGDPVALLGAVRRAAADPAIKVRADGPALREAVSAATVSAALGRTLVTAAALVLMLLALGLRRLTPLFVSAAATLSGLAVLVAVGGPVELLVVPLLAMMIGCAGEGQVQRQRQQIAVSGWAGPLILASALLPLLFGPYPLWHRWALAWFGAVAAFAVALRLLSAFRGASAQEKARGEGPGLGLRLRAWPPLAVLLCGGVLTQGALLSERLVVTGPAAIELGDPELRAAREALRRDFFDPDALVTVDSQGATLEEALGRSTDDAQALATGFADELRRLDTPGAFVINDEELDRRRDALDGLELSARMIDLEAALRRAKLRPQAFAEFLRGAVDLKARPSPETALAGPLSGWIAAHQAPAADGDGVCVRSRAFLQGEPGRTVVLGADGEPLTIRGPALAEARARRQLRGRLGLYAGIGLWIGALVIWLATRSLALALASAITAVASECAVITVLWSLGIALSPALLPAFLLVGAAGMIAGGRACRSIDRDRPLLVSAMLLASLCQVAGGLALVATREPAWQAFGIALASGCAIAPGLGIFATPGLYRLFRRVLREGREGSSR